LGVPGAPGVVRSLVFTPEQVRALRALEVLEQAGGPECLRIVETLAGGLPGVPLTEWAKQARQRMRAAAAPK
jgi:hypothetical protein